MLKNLENNGMEEVGFVTNISDGGCWSPVWLNWDHEVVKEHCYSKPKFNNEFKGPGCYTSLTFQGGNVEVWLCYDCWCPYIMIDGDLNTCGISPVSDNDMIYTWFRKNSLSHQCGANFYWGNQYRFFVMNTILSISATHFYILDDAFCSWHPGVPFTNMV